MIYWEYSMTDNSHVVLDTIIKETQKRVYPELTESDYFHLFATEQIMKDLELSYEEIDLGTVDDSGDGGIDGFYTFVNQELVKDKIDLIDAKRNCKIDVYVIQTKNAKSFSGTAVDKCISSAEDIFDLSDNIDTLKPVYNAKLLENVDIFRNQYLHLASKFPLLKFHYFYVAKSNTVHNNVEKKTKKLIDTIKKKFDKAEVSFEFITTDKLLNLSRREKLRSKEIALSDSPISTNDGGYIAVVPIKNYFEFITDEENSLIRYFFDANIRDYQGSVDINNDIKDTLENRKFNEDFWWLNNGVTITASNASFSSKRIDIQDPQVVNGLQTSFEIYKYFKSNISHHDDRNILIRVIKVENEKSRLNVIKATNSQTNIPPASLKSTDPIHRDIEDYLIHHDFYYDRRKNYHKNHGKPVSKIIGISYLAQIITAIYNQKPDYARARPSTLLKKDQDYEKIFEKKFPIEMYYKAILIQKKVEDCLRSFENPKLTRTQIGDIKFHISMYLTCLVTQKKQPNNTAIADIDVNKISSKEIEQSISIVYKFYDELGGTNVVAKGPELVHRIKEQIILDLDLKLV